MKCGLTVTKLVHS